MPRNGSEVYSVPAGTTATPNTQIESAKYNAFVADLTNDLNLARPIVAGGTGATTKSGAQQALDLEPGVDIQAYNAKLAALAALTLAADKLIYATGTNTLATSDLTAFARTLLEANDLAAVWTLLYLGALAGKEKISVPGDIDASGAFAWTYLAGDGVWRGQLGWGQSFHDVNASRSVGVSYQNTTQRPIFVAIRGSSTTAQVSVNNSTWIDVGWSGSDNWHHSAFVVPADHYYRLSGGTKSTWAELR